MNRIESLRALMAKEGADALVVSSELNQSYISGLDYTDGYVVILEKTAYVLADFRYIEAAEMTVDKSVFEIVMPEVGMLTAVCRILTEAGAKKVAFEESDMNVSTYLKLRGGIDKAVELAPCGSAMLISLREVKDEGEIETIARAQDITDRAFSHILTVIKPDMTERELALELEYTMRRMGADAMAFDIIAVSGTASSLPHGVPRDCKLERGFLTLDFGAKVGGYCSDMTRTVVIGKADDQIKKLYNTVLSAQQAALDFLREGVTGRDADKVARDIIDANPEYKGCFGHSLGHGVGRFIHESPRLARIGEAPLVRGNIVTVEPGIYLAGKYGCRIEDMVAITEDGIRNFTKSRKDLIEIY